MYTRRPHSTGYAAVAAIALVACGSADDDPGLSRRGRGGDSATGGASTGGATNSSGGSGSDAAGGANSGTGGAPVAECASGERHAKNCDELVAACVASPTTVLPACGGDNCAALGTLCNAHPIDMLECCVGAAAGNDPDTACQRDEGGDFPGCKRYTNCPEPPPAGCSKFGDGNNYCCS